MSRKIIHIFSGQSNYGDVYNDPSIWSFKNKSWTTKTMGTMTARWKCSSACVKANLGGSLKEFIYTCGGAKDLYSINLSTLDAAMISQANVLTEWVTACFHRITHITASSGTGDAIMETGDKFVCLNHNRLSGSNAIRSRRREWDSVESIHQPPVDRALGSPCTTVAEWNPV